MAPEVHNPEVPRTTLVSVPAETEHNRSFRTHAAYVSAFRSLALGGATCGVADWRHHLAGRARAAYEDVVRRRSPGDVDLDAVRACLHRAWGTEAILETTVRLSSDADLMRLASAWEAVQTYYAVYNAVQAVLVAEGKARAEKHQATQREFVDLWVHRRQCTLAPWSLAAVEPGTALACAAGFLNGPGRDLDLSIHAWATPAHGQEWDLAGKALRSTREDAISEQLRKERERKQKERRAAWMTAEAARVAGGGRARKSSPPSSLPRLTGTERSAARRRVRPYTVLDYLFRLRIKANYVDADVFSLGPDSDSAALAFSRALVEVAESTLLVHELRVAHLVGWQWLAATSDAWLAQHPGLPPAEGLAARRTLLAQT